MKEMIIALCTPDMRRPTALKAIEHLKNTDLRRAEVMILDNAYDGSFHHPSTMDEMLAYAAGRPIVFMDDDVLIKETNWIDRLLQVANESKADIVGCVHAFPTGEKHHHGILVYGDGSTELLRQVPCHEGDYAFVPAVSSALVLVKNAEGVRFDRQFEKYQHDVDICMSIWQSRRRVACALNLEIVHVQADYMGRVPGFRDILDRDIKRFQGKWLRFASSGLYEIPELIPYAVLARDTNWERSYNEASRLTSVDPERSAALFRQLIQRCPHPWHRAGAYYHLYLLEQRPEHLRNCIGQNPYHQKASEILRELSI